ncbi:MAG: pantetheine-phosphate adenylyltransferase [Flavobacterium sp.]|nr:pantetheine-phosphate adenylyltransferase [Flavobacterium sp.]
MKKAIFPGSFDPITLGHVDIIYRGLELFDEIIIAVGVNADKKYLFSLDERRAFIAQLFAGHAKIKVISYEGLTADLCKKEGAQYILRGLRNTTDFEFEKAIAQANAKLQNIETILLFSKPEQAYISSSIVRDVMRNQGDYSFMVPSNVRR